MFVAQRARLWKEKSGSAHSLSGSVIARFEAGSVLVIESTLSARLRRTRARGARTWPPSSRRPTAPGRPPARTSDVAAPSRLPPDVCRAAASAPRNQVPRGASTISRAAAARCVASSWPAGLLRPLRTTPATRARRSAHVFASGRNAPAARSFAARYSSRAARQFVSADDRS